MNICFPFAVLSKTFVQTLGEDLLGCFFVGLDVESLTILICLLSVSSRVNFISYMSVKNNS